MVVTLDDVAGLNDHKLALFKAFSLPLKKKDLYNALVLQPDKLRVRKTALFYGPPGTGKTFLAEALATSMEAPFNFYKSTEFIQGLVGQGANMLRDVYNSKEGIIFLDEIDAIGSTRTSYSNSLTNDVLLELLTCLDGVNANYNLITIAATNKISSLDDALLSRFTHKLEFKLPDAKQRSEIIRTKFSYFNHKIASYDFLVNVSEGFDSRKITDLFDVAISNALLNDRNYLLEQDFECL